MDAAMLTWTHNYTTHKIQQCTALGTSRSAYATWGIGFAVVALNRMSIGDSFLDETQFQ
jgi:hypothetical protein